MRTAFDPQIFLLQPRGGISRYIAELVTVFDARPDFAVEAVLPYRFVANEHASAIPGRGLIDAVGSLNPASLRGAAARSLLSAAARRPGHRYDDCDLVHHTFYHPRFLDLAPTRPRVVTVYDMIPERFPEAVPEGVHLAKDAYVRRADLVLVISEATKADLLDHYPGLSAPVLVTPLGVDPGFALPAPNPMPNRRYALYVGARPGYKDFAVVVAALARLGPTAPDLLVVGGGPWRPEELQLLRRAGLGDRVHRHDLDDRGLAGAYQHAAAFVFPSRYEGFGLPVLEAMTAGCPVVAADSSSLPEVGGEAAAYFTPQSVDGLADALQGVLGDEAAAARRVAAGRERAARFTWEATARRTAAAYATIA